jgi:hypothetical protein
MFQSYIKQEPLSKKSDISTGKKSVDFKSKNDMEERLGLIEKKLGVLEGI